MTRERLESNLRLVEQDRPEEPTYRLRDILSDSDTHQHYLARLRRAGQLTKAALPMVLLGAVLAVVIVVVLMLVSFYAGAIGL